MAKMFPPDGPSNPNLYGESHVYHLLAKLEDDFYIFQDRHWIFTNKEGWRTERETEGRHLGAFTWEKFKTTWMNDIKNSHIEEKVSN